MKGLKIRFMQALESKHTHTQQTIQSAKESLKNTMLYAKSILHIALFSNIMLSSLFFTTSYANDYDRAIAQSLKSGGKLYQKACASCHGRKGRTLPPGAHFSIPIIERSQGELVALLNSYRTGAVDTGGAKGTMSANLMRYKFSDTDIENIAYYVASLNPTPPVLQGYYYQVAAYHNEVPEEILARIAERDYVVHTTEYNGKELKRYLIGPYVDTQSMQADKEYIAELTEHTHVQKKMKPLVRYMSSDNELFSLEKDYELKDSLGMSLQTPQLYRAENTNLQKQEKKDSQDTQPQESQTNEIQEAQDSEISTQSQNTQNLDEAQEHPQDGVSTLKALFDSTQTNQQNDDEQLPNGYYYILATYAKTIPLDTLEKLKDEDYKLFTRGDFVHILIGSYDDKSTLLSHKAKAETLTKALHIHKHQDQKPRVIFVESGKIKELYLKEKNKK